MTGTLVNITAIVLGSILGLAVRSRLSEELIAVIFQGIGLVTVAIGVLMVMESEHIIVMAMSMALGAVTGHLAGLERRLEGLSGRLRSLVRRIAPRFASDGFTEGFVTSSILFSVGSMSILGSIEEGLGGEPRILLAKSLMDGTCSIVLASSLGAGVVFSALSVLAFQGSITLLAWCAASVVPAAVIAEMSGVGGVLLMGLGLNLLKITKISVINMLPALIFAAAITYIFY